MVSTDNAIELNGVFAPDLKEFLFARPHCWGSDAVHSELVDGVWTVQRELLLSPGRLGRWPTRWPSRRKDARSSSSAATQAASGQLTSGAAGASKASGRQRRCYPRDRYRRRRVGPVVVGDGSLYFIVESGRRYRAAQQLVQSAAPQGWKLRQPCSGAGANQQRIRNLQYLCLT